MFNTKVEQFMIDEAQYMIEELKIMGGVFEKQSSAIKPFLEAYPSPSGLGIVRKARDRESDLGQLLNQAQDIVEKVG